ncbi:MAG: hypothetical protein OHK0046_47760 [Anaerolineae bacterium]
MTTIVGIERDGVVYMAADSQTTISGYKYQITQKKLFWNRDILFGVTGSVIVNQLLRYHLQLPAHDNGLSDDHYMIQHVMPAVRTVLEPIKGDGYDDFWALMGYRGRLYMISYGFECVRPAEFYAAIGSGRDYAIGAVKTLMIHTPSMHPSLMVTTAVSVAVSCDTYSSSPVVKMSTTELEADIDQATPVTAIAAHQ